MAAHLDNVKEIYFLKLKTFVGVIMIIEALEMEFVFQISAPPL
jgi:hypothetical protein